MILFVGIRYSMRDHTACDDVTNQVTHRIFNTDSVYYCAHAVVDTDDKYNLNGAF